MTRAVCFSRVALICALSLSGRSIAGDEPPLRDAGAEVKSDSSVNQLLGNIDWHHDAAVANGVRYLVDGQSWLVRSAPENDIGTALTAVDEAARSQLGLHAGQGLVVSNLNPDGPAAKVGLKANDILLSLGDKFLGKPEDLSNQLKTAGETPVPLHVLRAGKRLTLTVKPVYRVTLGEVGPEKRDYFIGVPVQTPDDTLRAQLPELPEGTGLVATGVENESPAAKAGIKPYDILLELDGKRLTDMQALVSAIQATGGREASVKLLRGGKSLALKVTPELRKQSVEQAGERDLIYTRIQPYTVNLKQNQGVVNLTGTLKPQEEILAENGLVNLANELAKATRKTSADDELRKRLEEVARELKTIREELGELKKSLRKD